MIYKPFFLILAFPAFVIPLWAEIMSDSLYLTSLLLAPANLATSPNTHYLHYINAETSLRRHCLLQWGAWLSGKSHQTQFTDSESTVIWRRDGGGCLVAGLGTQFRSWTFVVET